MLASASPSCISAISESQLKVSDTRQKPAQPTLLLTPRFSSMLRYVPMDQWPAPADIKQGLTKPTTDPSLSDLFLDAI